MKIVINIDVDGACHLKSSDGLYRKFHDERHARAFAMGMEEGWAAAVKRLTPAAWTEIQKQQP